MGLGFSPAAWACAWPGGSAPGLSGSSLFDKFIGRKRDVGGGVLAGLFAFGWIWREPGQAGAKSKEMLTVTFQDSSRLKPSGFQADGVWNSSRIVGSGDASQQVTSREKNLNST
jgi:hypothetical protein